MLTANNSAETMVSRMQESRTASPVATHRRGPRLRAGAGVLHQLARTTGSGLRDVVVERGGGGVRCSLGVGVRVIVRVRLGRIYVSKNRLLPGMLL